MLKRLLGESRTTATAVVFQELGVLPLYLHWLKRVATFWQLLQFLPIRNVFSAVLRDSLPFLYGVGARGGLLSLIVHRGPSSVRYPHPLPLTFRLLLSLFDASAVFNGICYLFFPSNLPRNPVVLVFLLGFLSLQGLHARTCCCCVSVCLIFGHRLWKFKTFILMPFAGIAVQFLIMCGFAICVISVWLVMNSVLFSFAWPSSVPGIPFPIFLLEDAVLSSGLSGRTIWWQLFTSFLCLGWYFSLQCGAPSVIAISSSWFVHVSLCLVSPWLDWRSCSLSLGGKNKAYSIQRGKI